MWAWGIAAAASVGAAHIVARYAGAARVAGVLKAVPIALLAALVALEPLPVGTAFRWLVFAALLWSMAGDLWLVAPGGFVPGLSSFFVAHLFYLAAFAPGGGWGPGAWALGVPFALFGAAMLAYLWPRLGAHRVPVALYVGVIAAMGWRAAVRAGAAPAPSGALALAGALLFMVSDAALALDRFAGRFRAADAVVMTTYYAAQTLLALSVRG